MIIAFVILTIFILLIISLALFKNHKEKKYKNFIEKYSVTLESVRRVNQKYKFYPYLSFNLYHIYDNRKIFDTISCEDFLIYDLQFKKRAVLEQIKRIEYNKNLHEKYKKEVDSVVSFGSFNCNVSKMNMEKLKHMEIEAVNKVLLHYPLDFKIYVEIRLLNDRFGFSTKHNEFSVLQLLDLIERINKKNGSFYLDRGIWESIGRVERGKVTNKMRFAIYARDGYRCRCCKRKFDSKYLEIDHILPISKGGKSTYDNLQTLCHDCNQAKGTKFIKF